MEYINAEVCVTNDANHTCTKFSEKNLADVFHFDDNRKIYFSS